MEDQQPVAPVVEKKSSNQFLMVGIIAVLAIVGIGVTMMKKGPVQSESTAEESSESVTEKISEASPAVAAAETITESDADVKVINIEAGSFYYKPNEIKVKKGEIIKIILTSKDMMHDFNIDELGVKLPITKSGTTNSVEFVPEKTGTFEFYCSVGQHRKNGQIGKLIVE